jgi:hypothetical protein
MPEDQYKIKKESSSHNSVVGSDGAHYPFGTSLHLDDDLIEGTGASGLAVGDVVEVRGFAFVDRASEHSDSDGTEKSISLQLTTMKIRREPGDRAKQLYGDGS